MNLPQGSDYHGNGQLYSKTSYKDNNIQEDKDVIETHKDFPSKNIIKY